MVTSVKICTHCFKKDLAFFTLAHPIALKYEIILIENGDAIDLFIPETLTLKELGK